MFELVECLRVLWQVYDDIVVYSDCDKCLYGYVKEDVYDECNKLIQIIGLKLDVKVKSMFELCCFQFKIKYEQMDE